MESKKQSPSFDPTAFEKKWRQYWEKTGVYQPDLTSAKKPYYNLMMFPYPSAEGLHVGNMYAFTGADINGRYRRMKGYDVFEPIGLDGFGIHSENYALKIGKHPKEQAKISAENFYRQLHAIGNGFAFKNTLETYDPDYYKWTQWIFVQMFKHGLAYRKKSPLNFCPSCKTVLADEQVINGLCERCKSQVEKREMEQWFFKITDYAERLLQNTFKQSFQWSDKVKIGQRNWIGRSEGVRIEFRIQNSEFKIKVFTTAIDTIFGTTFMVLSPKHPLLEQLKIPEIHLDEVKDYIQASKKSQKTTIEIEKEKTGVFTGLCAINPFNNAKIPVWVADYVLMEYGTGAIMGVPGHDARDYEFARKYKLPIIPVVKPSDKIRNKITITEDGFWDYTDIKTIYKDESELFNSGFLNGLTSQQAKTLLEKKIVEMGIGEKVTTYKLRDWCISRQRYWGAPIPMINCPVCGWQPVPEDQLPVLLPDLEDWKPEGTGKGPLAKLDSFIVVKCPKCGGEAKRETDVCDTFLDSSWYFLRYPSTHCSRSKQVPWDPEITKKWFPVTQYIGGAEHTVLHLLYARFVTMAFKDWEYIDFEEPFSRFYAHGLIIAEGAKMSKSRGNVVIPDVYINKYGTDALRTYLMFLGPFDQGGDFRDTGIAGMHRFLGRVWRLVNEHIDQRGNSRGELLLRFMHYTIKEVTEDLENFRYNTAIAHIMEYVNQLTDNLHLITDDHIKSLLLMLAPFAPYMTEELWHKINLEPRTENQEQEKILSSKSLVQGYSSIHLHPWPSYDQKYLVEEEVTIVIQVNGKTREITKINNQKSKVKSEVEEDVKKLEKIKKHLDGKTIRKVIFVPGRLINFVVS